MPQPPIDNHLSEPEQEKPPVFSKWGHWYAVVLLDLALLIILFFLFMKVFD